MIQNTLQHLGYSEKEWKVYLALLELWPSPASTVSYFIKENRVTVYSVLKILVKKWLILESKRNKVYYFSALDPQILLEKEKDKYEWLRQSLPEMLSLMNQHTNKPKVVFYEWIEGLNTLLKSLLVDFRNNPHTEIHWFLWARYMDKSFENFLRNSLEKKKQKPKEIPTKVIIVWDYNYWYASYCRENYTTKTVEELNFPMEHEIFAYGDKVVILMYQSSELSGVIIESKSLAQGIRSMFDLVWKYAPDIKKNTKVL